jgi:hypothetical protein
LTAELARERALYEVLVDEDRPVEVIGACIARIEHLRLSLRQEGAAT